MIAKKLILAIAVTLAGASAAHAATRTVLVDNDRLTIFKLEFAPGEVQATLHPPPGTGQIVTLITPADVKNNFNTDGVPSSENGRLEPGKTWWLSKTTLHQFGNASATTPYSVIVTTLK